MRTQAGYSLLELTFVFLILAVLMAVALPNVRASNQDAQLIGASDVFKGEFRKARSIAIASGGYTAIVFDQEVEPPTFSVYQDGNRNGVRRADIRAGRDPRLSGPFPLDGNTPGVRAAILPGTPAVPPESGTLEGDPIRFGNSNILSFSPIGTATPGTFYLAGAGDRQSAVRVTGSSSRVRVMICRGGQWRDE